MGSFSFVHAADLHLDTPFAGVEASAPHVAAALRDASISAFQSIIDLAIEREVDFVCFAGDIYDGAERGIRAQLLFLDGLTRLDEHGIRSFIVHGNHDPVESGWTAVSSSWPANVTIFPPLGPHDEHVPVVRIIKGDAQIATVQGISYKERATTANLAMAFARPDGPGTHIGVLHCNVEGSPNLHANYSPCTLDDLSSTGLDYLALGHVHDRRILSGRGAPREPWVVYPGNSQARSINETGPKGVYVVTVRDGVIEEPEFVACDSVRFSQRDVPIDDLDDIVDLVSRLRDVEQEILAEAGGRSEIVRVTLTGRGPLHAALQPRDALTEVLESIRSLGRTYTPFCWWERIIDRTLPVLDLDEIRTRGDFASDLVHLTEEYRDDPDEQEGLFQHLIESAPKAFRKELAQLLGSDQRRELISAAQLRALDEIIGEA